MGSAEENKSEKNVDHIENKVTTSSEDAVLEASTKVNSNTYKELAKEAGHLEEICGDIKLLKSSSTKVVTSGVETTDTAATKNIGENATEISSKDTACNNEKSSN